MRSVNPFSYFVDHASQLRGFGGERPSPDPQYCFHTRYETVRPGRAIFSLSLFSANATQGELTVRVHAFRPDVGGMPSLAAGGRLELAGAQSEDLAVAIPFHAVSGVEYALYGFFSEPTNLSVDRVEIMLDEPDGGEDTEIVAPHSLLEQPAAIAEAGPATGLIHYGPVERARPVSQDCTWRQLEPGSSIAERLARWREAVCLAALTAYDVDLPGLDGWVVGEASDTLREAMIKRPVALFFHDDPSAHARGEFADFIVWPNGRHDGADPRGRWAELHAWLGQLKIGGFAAIGVGYQPDQSRTEGLTRNEIKQWAQRLIGLGYSVAPLAFADLGNLVIDEAGSAASCLIVRRQ